MVLRPKPPVLRDARSAVVAWALQGVKWRGTFTYTEGSDRWLWVEGTDEEHRHADCSSFVTGCYRHANCLHDPNKSGWRWGDTETLAAGGLRIPRWRAKQADLVILGLELPLAEQHAVVIVAAEQDPFVVSHGEQGNPALIRLSEDPRSKAFFRYVTASYRPVMP